MELFGFEIKRSKSETEKSFVPPHDDGSIESIKAGGYYGTYFDIEGTANSETQLIKRYRDISQMGDVDAAIEDVVNDAIANLDDEKPVKLNLDNVQQSATVKKAIVSEFDGVLRMLDFNTRAQDYFRRWYIDGRIFFHKVIDTEKGIATNTQLSYRSEEVNEKAIKVSKDSVTYCTSGLVDQDRNIPLSYLHKAIRPANQLRMMENAVVIYRITRAPERRIFYIDVGNLPTGKAEQYLKDVMSRYRNKLVYDSDTGEIRDDKKFMSMLEDFWLPRKEGGRGTEIQTLPGGANLGEIEDVVYFQKKLYQALNVPVSRLEQQAGLNFGRSAEITRDELKFTKFVSKLRNRFSGIFDDLLKTQLVLKGVINEEEWPDIKNDLQYMFASDAYYTESKDQEVLRSRLEILNGIVPFMGQLFSKEYVQKNIMRFSDEEISMIEGQIAAAQEAEAGNEITNGDKDE